MTIENPSQTNATKFVGKKFSRYHALEELAGSDPIKRQTYLAALANLIKDFKALPPNKFDVPARLRRLGRCTLYANERRLEWHPPEKFDEAGRGMATLDLGDFNVDYDSGASTRYYPVLEKHTQENPLINGFVWLDFDKVDWSEEELSKPHRISVELHRLLPKGEEWLVGTPNMFHQDGETATFCHLIERSNVVGGENAVGTLDRLGTTLYDEGHDPKSVLARFTMLEPLESWGGLDREIVHYVGPLKRDNPKLDAERSLVIISIDGL